MAARPRLGSATSSSMRPRRPSILADSTLSMSALDAGAASPFALETEDVSASDEDDSGEDVLHTYSGFERRISRYVQCNIPASAIYQSQSIQPAAPGGQRARVKRKTQESIYTLVATGPRTLCFRSPYFNDRFRIRMYQGGYPAAKKADLLPALLLPGATELYPATVQKRATAGFADATNSKIEVHLRALKLNVFAAYARSRSLDCEQPRNIWHDIGIMTHEMVSNSACGPTNHILITSRTVIQQANDGGSSSPLGNKNL
ncbi:hypothetical protein B0H17DRAFT_1184126, partial [Mycena rosella]